MMQSHLIILCSIYFTKQIIIISVLCKQHFFFQMQIKVKENNTQRKCGETMQFTQFHNISKQKSEFSNVFKVKTSIPGIYV